MGHVLRDSPRNRHEGEALFPGLTLTALEAQSPERAKKLLDPHSSGLSSSGSFMATTNFRRRLARLLGFTNL